MANPNWESEEEYDHVLFQLKNAIRRMRGGECHVISLASGQSVAKRFAQETKLYRQVLPIIRKHAEMASLLAQELDKLVVDPPWSESEYGNPNDEVVFTLLLLLGEIGYDVYPIAKKIYKTKNWFWARNAAHEIIHAKAGAMF